MSFAIWCKPKQHSATTQIEAHFNYWHVAGDRAFRRSDRKPALDFIEFGVLVDDPTNIDAIKIFMPFEVKEKAISDCSDYFRAADIAQGIFNDVLRGAGPAAAGPRCIELLRADNSTFSRIHSFTLSKQEFAPTELTVIKRDGGTLLSIERGALNDATNLWTPGVPAYFRLRVSLNFDRHNPFVRVIPTPDRFFQSSYEEIEYLDFRVNEARTLPDRIEMDMRTEQGVGVKLRLVAFLTAIPVQSEIAISNTPSHKMRLLEHDLWNTYMPGGIPEGMMVYHWKRSLNSPGITLERGAIVGEINDFTAFVKLMTRRSGKQIYLAYIVIAFTFGVLGNLAANYVQKGLDAATTWTMEAMPSGALHRPKLGYPEATTGALERDKHGE
ncbi:hypothetical protein HN018_21065 [Lichenicola cladoniae]|uniref:Uncharacterized protein n=1 Tax=Lichenicola cladoniae TaxID=1484109 RepID=A0A6M8HUZ7_9PROT|nr:hypothetical protein [Lichenicola cladoniae]NPD69430.1 hypothetical protein [Acetobacteraceae bacterium]QKE92192.1 hypothetical protein HN018_21065 [Lichenicola cladoniae]